MRAYIVVVMMEETIGPQVAAYDVEGELFERIQEALKEAGSSVIPEPRRHVRILADQMNIRRGPADDFLSIGTTRKGQIYPVFEIKDDRFDNEWIRISELGWIVRIYRNALKADWV